MSKVVPISHEAAPEKSGDDMIVTLRVSQLRVLIREEIAAAMNGNGHAPSKREWLKAQELAAEYGQPKTWFEERGRAGDIARNKSGRFVLFKRSDVEMYLEQHCKKEPIVRKKRKKEGEPQETT